MDNTQRVLLVEDERAIRDAVAAYLEREGFWVTAVADGAAALEVASRKRFDLVVLDLNLPKVPGEEVCRRIRNASDVPIIMLTAKGAEEERIRGLEMGADDYLVKPFSPRELVARVRALLRRAHAESDPQRDRLDYAGLSIDLPSHRAHLDGVELDLTASEYPRMELVEKVLGYDFEGYERAIDSHVKNLRAKLGDDPREPRFIQTVTGVGYRFEPAAAGQPDPEGVA
jgi:two-component system response regulator RegX3